MRLPYLITHLTISPIPRIRRKAYGPHCIPKRTSLSPCPEGSPEENENGRYAMSTRKTQHGFTLIELMITVAVIGILVAIGLPSYNSAIRKGNRSDAQAALMDIASRQQQMLVDTRRYVATVAELHISVPPKVAAQYAVTITLGAGLAPTFVTTATPLGAQAQDSCGTLSLDNNGVKQPTNCW